MFCLSRLLKVVTFNRKKLTLMFCPKIHLPQMFLSLQNKFGSYIHPSIHPSIQEHDSVNPWFSNLNEFGDRFKIFFLIFSPFFKFFAFFSIYFLQLCFASGTILTNWRIFISTYFTSLRQSWNWSQPVFLNLNKP
jgi:hypothetical protein